MVKAGQETKPVSLEKFGGRRGENHRMKSKGRVLERIRRKVPNIPPKEIKGEKTSIAGGVDEHEKTIAKLEERIIKQTMGGIPEGTKLYESVPHDEETKVAKRNSGYIWMLNLKEKCEIIDI